MKRPLIKILIIGILILIVLAGAAWGTGLLLPRDHHASSSITLAASRDEIWTTLVDVPHYTSWRSDLETVEIETPAGDRMRWTERGENGELPFEVVERNEPGRLVIRIRDEGLPFGGSWTYELTEEARGTRLTITENGSVYNPIFRVVATLFMSEHATMDRYLRDLGASFSQDVTPTHQD